jgi:hypothetical protein
LLSFPVKESLQIPVSSRHAYGSKYTDTPYSCAKGVADPYGEEKRLRVLVATSLFEKYLCTSQHFLSVYKDLVLYLSDHDGLIVSATLKEVSNNSMELSPS